jgi:hypothetical protein
MPGPAQDLEKIREKRNRQNMSRKHTLDYHRNYNDTHSEELATAKKNRYDTDPEYREAAKKRAATAYERKKKLQEEIRRIAGPPPVSSAGRSTNHLYCPLCMQPVPRPRAPVYKSVGKKYAVAMFTVRELSRRLGKQAKTVQLWLRDKVIPDTLYKDRRTKEGTTKAIMTRLWTQDQIEMLMRVFDSYDLRPPVSFEKIGLVAEVRKEWDALRPLGIVPSLYTEQTEHGLLARPSAELPMPGWATKTKKAG